MRGERERAEKIGWVVVIVDRVSEEFSDVILRTYLGEHGSAYMYGSMHVTCMHACMYSCLLTYYLIYSV